MNNQKNPKSRLATILKWGLGGFIGWNLLVPEARDGIREFVSNEIDAYNQRQAEIARQQKIQELIDNEIAANKEQSIKLERQRRIQGILDTLDSDMETSQKTHVSASTSITPHERSDKRLRITSLPSSNSLSEQHLDLDRAWKTKIVHPSVLLILGKRGSGKTALGYRLLEILRYVADIYVVGVPEEARKLLPKWIGIVPSLGDLPVKCIALVDEAYLSYHARGSMTAKNKAMSQALNLSRQKDQTIIFISQDAGQIDKNILSAANILIFKELGMLQLEFDRPQLTKMATQAKQAMDSVRGNRKQWCFVYAPDADFLGLMENGLPSFWKPSLSRLFAHGPAAPTTRQPKSLTLQDRQKRALEMRAQGDSYGVIARELGVSRGTVVNYIKRYPYR